MTFARSWIAAYCPGLFADASPFEIDLTPGKIPTAHTGYWTHHEMIREICTLPLPDAEALVSKQVAPKAKPTLMNRASANTAFSRATWAVAGIVAWLGMVWWEENIKENNAAREVSGNPGVQLGFWFVAGLTVLTHAMWKQSRNLSALWRTTS